MEPLGILYYQFLYILYLTMAIEIPKMNNMRSPGTYLDKQSRSFQLPSFFVMNRAVESVSLYKDGAPTSNS